MLFTLWKTAFKNAKVKTLYRMVVVKLLPGSASFHSLAQSQVTGTESCSQVPTAWNFCLCSKSSSVVKSEQDRLGLPPQLVPGCSPKFSWPADVMTENFSLSLPKQMSSYSPYCLDFLPACHLRLSFVLVSVSRIILSIYQWFHLLFMVTLPLWQLNSLLPIVFFSQGSLSSLLRKYFLSTQLLSIML